MHLLFFLFCTALLARTKPIVVSGQREMSHEAGQSFLDYVTYNWLTPLVHLGYRRPLQADDLWALRPDDEAAAVVRLYRRHKRASLLMSLIRVSRNDLILQLTCSTIYALMSFSLPLFMNLLIDYVANPAASTPAMAMLYAVGMFVGSVTMSSFGQRAYWIGRQISIRVRAIISNELFIKSLRRRIEGGADKKADEKDDDPADAGSITNLLSVDTNSIGDISAYLHQIWFSPIRIMLSFVFLWRLLGASMLFGFLVTIPLFYISTVASKQFTDTHEKLMKKTDKRLAASNEVLQGIRIIKLFAWEQQFRERVMSRRKDELDSIWKRLLMFVYFTVIGAATPTIITFTIFGAHTWILGNPLTASTAFTSLALLNILRDAIEQLPESVVWTLQGRVSLGRIAKFLAEPDIEYEIPSSSSSSSSTHDETGTPATANQPAEAFALKGLSMQFPIGAFSVIAGPTGCGKSSLLHALLGEMRCTRGRVLIPRRPADGTIFGGSIHNVAYVAQQAWLQNLSIRDNILFGEAYDEQRYQQVLHACALTRDLEILDAGDRTEIGEKGVTLSGGQKQRVALARAVYSSARHLLLDDCLSAVDAHTAKHIVEHCLQGPLMAGRTRILVTHHVELCAPLANYLVIMQEGRVAGHGSLDTVLAAGLLPELSPSDSETVVAKEENDDDEEKTPLVSKQPAAASGKLTEDEEHKHGAVGLAVYRTYIEASGGYGAWAIVVLLYLLSQAVIIAQTYWLRTWANSYDTEDKQADADEGDVEQRTPGYYLAIYVGFGALFIAIAVVRNVILYRGSLKASMLLFARLLERIMHARIRFFDMTPIGRIMNRFSKDIETIDLEVAPCIAFLLVAAVEAIGTVVAISYVTPKFLFASVFIAAAYIVISTLFVRTSRELKRIESVSKSPLFTLFGEAINGVSTIRAFGVESRFMRISMERTDDMNRPYYLIWAVNRWLSWRTDFFGAVVSFSAAVFILFASNSVDAGLAGFSLSFALNFVDIMMWLIRIYGYVEMNMNSIERVAEYLEIEQEAPAIVEDNRVDEHWPETGEVKVEGLMVQYTQDHGPVIQDLSFAVQPGERVGIVGRTGAGKSTLALSLFRFVEASSGRIIIDNVDISKIGLHDLRSHLTIIPQDPVLFNGTIRSNIDPFSAYDDEAIWAALRRSHLIDAGDHRPPGLESLDAPVSENGANFSQGQRQLLAMARALLRTNKLIIMDEATASVDFDTDAKIQQTIRQEFSQATLLCIAHRLRTIIDYDKVLVMDAGRLVEYDAPSTLIQQPDSLFRQLCERSGEFETLLELANTARSAEGSR
ncbi:P-loop containing nucleoside triphosphate hydrolase protein [Syncephalis pseudoplumigaleata]|uniref:P-loop containing nucleoside triphosphate hydrolase protein n=1 Tax=Syncephalis pseudoplumigaleata TaxID=1712513 RepID=A0A4P9YYM2_9FUNG|nr:P-loop containing nucleoside triphosphate hydrolase protein [Syncephalis pseudoplumigaleata]|eukprot:RKP25263.1 P-loop containing nucleoside triphosphate hydrolase protein [Syncephalis pseudoplumigaleata]